MHPIQCSWGRDSPGEHAAALFRRGALTPRGVAAATQSLADDERGRAGHARPARALALTTLSACRAPHHRRRRRPPRRTLPAQPRAGTPTWRVGRDVPTSVWRRSRKPGDRKAAPRARCSRRTRSRFTADPCPSAASRPVLGARAMGAFVLFALCDSALPDASHS